MDTQENLSLKTFGDIFNWKLSTAAPFKRTDQPAVEGGPPTLVQEKVTET